LVSSAQASRKYVPNGVVVGIVAGAEPVEGTPAPRAPMPRAPMTISSALRTVSSDRT